ncbi:MAG TPA: NfeD family protein, partial [Flavisolibacter sp.]|nr:NfeD family protein [Flavisolibacter sp.]
ILPGIAGVIALILAFYSMHALPVNYAGLALIVFGIILFILEIKIVSHGLLAIGGIISLTLGSFMLIRASSSLEVVRISTSVIISAAVVTTLFFLFVIGLGLRAQKPKPVTGVDGLVGITGEAFSALNPEGTVRVHGEIWNAESLKGPIQQGEKVLIKAVKGLRLYVEKMKGSSS